MPAEPRRRKILFLCTGNSCRSQMAEGWARALKADVLEPYSAGIQPQELDPHAVRVMAEVGIDISGQRAKHRDELKDVRFDDPPALVGRTTTEGEALVPYRRVRDEIRAFVATLPAALENLEG